MLLELVLSKLAYISSEAAQLWANQDDVEGRLSSFALRTVVFSGIALIVLVIISAQAKKHFPKLKPALFAMMATAMAGSVLVLLGTTIYLNTISDSGGPVHWHADFEIWACGNQLELRDPTGFSNKVGTPVLHEHDDQRIHLEGVVVDKTRDATFGKFMYVVGGEVSNSRLVVPLNPSPDRWFEDAEDGDRVNAPNPALLSSFINNYRDYGTLAEFDSGDSCGDVESFVQVFAYHYDEANNVYWQEKLSQPELFAIAQHSQVPPGNCIIIEFGPLKDRTDYLCAQYGVRDIDRCEDFGVPADKRSICEIREVSMVTGSGEIIELDDSGDELEEQDDA